MSVVRSGSPGRWRSSTYTAGRIAPEREPLCGCASRGLAQRIPGRRRDAHRLLVVACLLQRPPQLPQGVTF